MKRLSLKNMKFKSNSRPSPRPSLPPSKLQLESHPDEPASNIAARPTIINSVRRFLKIQEKGGAAPTTTRASATDTCIESSLTECDRSGVSVEDGSAFSEAAPFREPAQLHMSQDVDKLPVQPPRSIKGLSMTVPEMSSQAVRVHGDEDEGKSDDAPSSSVVPCSTHDPINQPMGLSASPAVHTPASPPSDNSFRPLAHSPSGASRASSRTPSPTNALDDNVYYNAQGGAWLKPLPTVDRNYNSGITCPYVDRSGRINFAGGYSCDWPCGRNDSRSHPLCVFCEGVDYRRRREAAHELSMRPLQEWMLKPFEESRWFKGPPVGLRRLMDLEKPALGLHRRHRSVFVFSPMALLAPDFGTGKNANPSGSVSPSYTSPIRFLGMALFCAGARMQYIGEALLSYALYEPADDTCGVEQRDNVVDGEARMWVRYETHCVDLSAPMDDSGLLPPEPGQDHTYLNMYPPRHAVAAPMVFETSEYSEDITLEQDVVYDEASAAPSVSADMGGTRGVAGVLRRVESACRGVLSTAAAWAIHARDVIATMAHTTAAFAGLA